MVLRSPPLTRRRAQTLNNSQQAAYANILPILNLADQNPILGPAQVPPNNFDNVILPPPINIPALQPVANPPPVNNQNQANMNLNAIMKLTEFLPAFDGSTNVETFTQKIDLISPQVPLADQAFFLTLLKLKLTGTAADHFENLVCNDLITYKDQLSERFRILKKPESYQAELSAIRHSPAIFSENSISDRGPKISPNSENSDDDDNYDIPSDVSSESDSDDDSNSD